MTSILNNGIRIVPVHMHSVFSGRFFSLHSNLDENKFHSLTKNLNSDDVYILDFESIKNTLVSDSVATGAAGLMDKKVMLTNLKSSTYKLFKSNFDKDLLDYKSTSKNKSLITKQFPGDSVKLPDLTDFLYLTAYLKEECKKNLKAITVPKEISSNYYVNKFFDLSKMFGNMDTVKVAVYLMAKKMEELERKYKMLRYKLVSSSFNGSVLANLVALIKMRKHISIPHLGPSIAVDDNRYMKYIKKHDKLVYIYDFIALGNEQKTVSIIAKLYNAEVICSLGLTDYKHYQQKDEKTSRTHSLVNFSEISKPFYAAAEREHVERLMRTEK